MFRKDQIILIWGAAIFMAAISLVCAGCVSTTPAPTVSPTIAPTPTVNVTVMPSPTMSGPTTPVQHVSGIYGGGANYTVMLTAFGGSGYRTTARTGPGGKFEVDAATSLPAYSLSVYDDYGNVVYNDPTMRSFSASGYDDVGTIP